MQFYPGSERCFVKMFASDGKLRAEGVYEGQKKDSTWKYLGNDGKVRMTEQYNHGILSGITESYYPSGNLSRRWVFHSGIKDGPWIQWFEKGDTMLVANYVEGMLHGNYFTYYQNGKDQISGAYYQDEKDGDWHYYAEDGSLVSVISYDKGTVLNPEELERIYESFIKQLEETEGTIPDPAFDW